MLRSHTFIVKGCTVTRSNQRFKSWLDSLSFLHKPRIMEMEALRQRGIEEIVEPEANTMIEDSAGNKHCHAPLQVENAQIWKDVEAETGFVSYIDYLEASKDVRPELSGLLKACKELRQSTVTSVKAPEICIYDVSQAEDDSTGLNLRCCCSSGTELIQAVRQPLPMALHRISSRRIY